MTKDHLPALFSAATFIGTVTIVVVGFVYTNSRIDAVRAHFDNRIDDLRAHLDARIGDLCSEFCEHLRRIERRLGLK